MIAGPDRLVTTRTGRQVRPPRRLGDSPEDERSDTSADLSLMISDPDSNERTSAQTSPAKPDIHLTPDSLVSDRSLSWDNLTEPTDYQLDMPHFSRPPAGLLQYDGVFWGEQEKEVMESPKMLVEPETYSKMREHFNYQLPKRRQAMSPRDRKRKQSQAKHRKSQ